MSLLIDGAEGQRQVGRGPNTTTTSSAFHRVAGSGVSQNTTSIEISSLESSTSNAAIQRKTNSPVLIRSIHAPLLNETNVPKPDSGTMTTAPGLQPLQSISPTRSGEGRTEDEVDSPTPSSTASEPTDQFFPSPKSNQRSTHRVKDAHLKSPHLKNFNAEDARTTDEEDLEGGRDDAFAWPTHSSYDEQRQLLGTEEESSDRASSEDELLGDDDDEGGDVLHKKDYPHQQSRSVWAITKEQLNYYTTQFFNMQSNPVGLIPGTQAKEFFEKSRLPISELRTIWQLSDVSKDGCLSLDEFLTAMHLVVLRRNEIALPESLPNCLRPEFIRKKLETRTRNLISEEESSIDALDGTLIKSASRIDKSNINLGEKQASAISSGPRKEMVNESLMPGESSFKPQETTPAADDTISLASLVSSPGAGDRPKPVNFDFMRPDIRRDPHIIQPLPLRISSPPDSPLLGIGRSETSDLDGSEEENAKRAEQMRRPSGHQPKGEVVYEQFPVSESDDDEDGASSLPMRQAGVSSFNGSKAGPISLPHGKSNNSSQHPLGLSKKEGDPPPLPPPRTGPGNGHNRSSSLDYNIGNSRINTVQVNSGHQRQVFNSQAYNTSTQQQQSILTVGGPPIPPRYPSHESPESCTPIPSSATSTPPARSPSPRASTTGAHHLGVYALRHRTAGPQPEGQSAMSELSRDTKKLQIGIQEFKERNSVVARTINELHQEVSDTLEERIALEYQLEQLKSFGDQ